MEKIGDSNQYSSENYEAENNVDVNNIEGQQPEGIQVPTQEEIQKDIKKIENTEKLDEEFCEGVEKYKKASELVNNNQVLPSDAVKFICATNEIYKFTERAIDQELRNTISKDSGKGEITAKEQNNGSISTEVSNEVTPETASVSAINFVKVYKNQKYLERLKLKNDERANQEKKEINAIMGGLSKEVEKAIDINLSFKSLNVETTPGDGESDISANRAPDKGEELMGGDNNRDNAEMPSGGERDSGHQGGNERD